MIVLHIGAGEEDELEKNARSRNQRKWILRFVGIDGKERDDEEVEVCCSESSKCGRLPMDPVLPLQGSPRKPRGGKLKEAELPMGSALTMYWNPHLEVAIKTKYKRIIICCHLCRHTTVDMKTSDEIFSFKKFKTVPGIGIILGMTSGFMYSLAILNLKLVSEISPAQILITQALIQWGIYNVFIVYSKTNYFGLEGERTILFFRALFGGIIKVLMIHCIHWLPLADASTIYSSSPVFISLLAYLVLREPCRAYNVFVLMLTMTGIILIIKPTFIVGTFQDIQEVGNRWKGITIGFSACLLKACCYTMARKLQRTPPQVVAGMMSTVSLLMGTLLLFLFEETKISSCGKSSVLVVSSGICLTLNQLLTTIALQVENAGPVSVAQTLNIITAFLFDIFILNTIATWYSICGAVLIFVGVLLTTLRKVN
ncbi:solute carrier family 35 member G1-like [Tachypleus tridentatus]|uniref:solute carrier family 35 member G1-like n=1 Tax=Tachypleus tridentatus TaxID=6853 RepID=UPI003FD45351